MRKHGAAVRKRRTDTSIGVENKFRYIYTCRHTFTYYRNSPRSIVERILRVWPVKILKCAW